MGSHAIEYGLTLTTHTCCGCAIVFAMPDELRARLKRDGGTFYCPNGHAQHFTQTETDRLRGLLEEANRSKTQLAASYASLQSDYDTLQRAKKRIEKRIHAGTCPCCNRTFQNLARHMATKHKEIGS
jgi:hypothetical protein